MFVRMCQATYLLGRVILFRQSAETDEESFHNEQRVQLDRTIRALLNLVYQEGALLRTLICAQSSIAYRLVNSLSDHERYQLTRFSSALIILHDPTDTRNDWDHVESIMQYMECTLTEMSAASGVWFRNRFVSLSNASPFLVFWPYHVMTVINRLPWQQNAEAERIMRLMLEKLRLMSKRWLLGGEWHNSNLDFKRLTWADAYAEIFQASMSSATPR